jgi:arylsulfatase
MGVGDGHPVQVGEAGAVAFRGDGPGHGHILARPHHGFGGIRRQFHHVIDIVPTILEATGIPAPDTINGIVQASIEGVSLAYTWDKANADAPSRHTTQYFEMLGNRAIYHDGWVAATTPATLPWELSTASPPDVITGYNWELYNVREDPTQSNDLAATMPEKVTEMKDLFYSEARKYGVLPLDNLTLPRWNTPRSSLTAGRKVFTYSGDWWACRRAPHRTFSTGPTPLPPRSRFPTAGRKA